MQRRDLTVFSAFSGLVSKAAVPRAFQDLEGRGGWHSLYAAQSPFDFDRDIRYSYDAVLSNWTVFACMTLIAGDIGKMRPRLMEQDGKGIWSETQSPAFSPVLRKPNQYQTWQKFIESWMLSKLSHGNTFVLKERDERKVVIALHVLDPDRVVPSVSPSGSVFYKIRGGDDLTGVPDEDEVRAPAREIIHDRMWCLFHPLIGLSPIFACGLAAAQGLSIQKNSAIFFANMSRPSGVLTAPGFLSEEQAEIYKKRWDQKYGSGKQGATAILGNGLVYSPISHSAKDSELVDQLKLTAEMICSTFHVPGWKVGVGARPAYQNANIEQQSYYNDCVQVQMQGVEALLTEGLGADRVADKTYRIDLDEDALLRMDEGALTDVLVKQRTGGIAKIDELRQRLNLPPTPGGDAVYLQHQDHSTAALAKRDAKDDPFESGAQPAPAAPAAPMPAPDKELIGMLERAAVEAREAAQSIARETKEAKTSADEMSAWLKFIEDGLETLEPVGA